MHLPVLIVTDGVEGAIINPVRVTDWDGAGAWEKPTHTQAIKSCPPPPPCSRYFEFMVRIVGHQLPMDDLHEQWPS